MPADPTSVFFEAIRAYLIAVHPRFPIERLKLIGRDGSKISLRVQMDLSPVSTFVPTPFQQAILEALDGKALRTDALGAAVGDRSRLFKPNGLKELRERGSVDHHDRVGFYRTDAPPPELEGVTTMSADPTAALFDAVRVYAAAYRPGHAPRRVVVVYDDGEKDGRPIPPCVCVPPAADRLTAMEENVLDALAGGLTLTGQQIADATGYPHDKDLKACLAAMRRRGVLTGARGDVGYAVANS